MGTVLELTGMAFGALLLLLAGPLAGRAWKIHGAPYGFASVRAFRVTYVLVGLIVGVTAATSLLAGAVVDPVGVVMVPLGAELCMRSRTLGRRSAADAHREERTAQFQRGVFVVGALIALFAPVVALHL
jgi:hypothetical protein